MSEAGLAKVHFITWALICLRRIFLTNISSHLWSHELKGANHRAFHFVHSTQFPSESKINQPSSKDKFEKFQFIITSTEPDFQTEWIVGMEENIVGFDVEVADTGFVQVLESFSKLGDYFV